MLKEYLSEELRKIRWSSLWRETTTYDVENCAALKMGESGYINFSSNNYLCLLSEQSVKDAAATALAKYGAGGTSSRLLAGTFKIHAQLEESLSDFKRTEAALVFPTGFQANIGALSALLSGGGCVILDKLAHASLWDGAKLAKSKTFVFEHNDPESLESVLKKAAGYKVKIIATESVFSMDGDIAPLDDIVKLAKRYGAFTYVDEAHATGIFGESGSGVIEMLGLNGEVDVVMGTLSKALGSQGGFVCGSRELVDFLKNKSRSFIYTTSLSPVACAAALEAICIIRREPQRRKELLATAASLKSEILKLGFNAGKTQSQIIPVMTNTPEKTEALSAELFNNGIIAPKIRPPTVPEGKCRIRISLNSGHTREELNRLLKVLGENR